MELSLQTGVILGGCGIVWAIQLFYVIFVYSQLVFYREPEGRVTEGISIVVACHDDLEGIVRLLPRLQAQKNVEYEVIIVDDRSDIDNHLALKAELAKYPGFRLIQVRACPPHIHPKKYAITLAIKAATYERILLTDADCVPLSNDWAMKMTSLYTKDTDFVLGYSPNAKQKGFLNSFIRYETFISGIQYLSLALWGMPYMGVGRNLSYTKSIFLNNNGFGKFQNITGGDDDLFVNQHARAGRVSVCITAQTLTQPKSSWAEYLVQKKRHYSVSRYYRFKHKLVLGLANMSHFLTLPAALVSSLLTPFWWTGLSGYFLWSVVRMWVLLSAKKRLKETIEPGLLLIHELIYPVFLFVIGTVAYLTKTVRWK